MKKDTDQPFPSTALSRTDVGASTARDNAPPPPPPPNEALRKHAGEALARQIPVLEQLASDGSIPPEARLRAIETIARFAGVDIKGGPKHGPKDDKHGPEHDRHGPKHDPKHEPGRDNKHEAKH